LSQTRIILDSHMDIKAGPHCCLGAGGEDLYLHNVADVTLVGGFNSYFSGKDAVELIGLKELDVSTSNVGA
jgi:hypothetical protein